MIAKLVGLVDQHQVVFVGIPNVIVAIVKYLAQTAVTHKAGIFFETEVLEGGLPVLFYGRRVDHQNLRMFWTVLNQELLGYHRGDNCLAETHHICEEETIITY